MRQPHPFPCQWRRPAATLLPGLEWPAKGDPLYHTPPIFTEMAMLMEDRANSPRYFASQLFLWAGVREALR
jgi:hypothetical protein